jgi:hypothetical protein
MSPALMEAYLSAAGKISRLAIGDVSAPSQVVFDVPPDTAQNYHVEGLPFGTRGGMLIPYQFPADGDYSFKVKGVTGYFQAVLGGVKGEQLEVTIYGERVKLFDWDKEIANTTGNGRDTTHSGQGRPSHRRSHVPRNKRHTGAVEPAISTNHEHARHVGLQFYPHVSRVEGCTAPPVRPTQPAAVKFSFAVQPTNATNLRAPARLFRLS